MPAFVGAVQVVTVGSAGVFHIGDSFQISPISYAKTFAGAGSFNTGEVIQVKNKSSSTNTFDNDLVDQARFFNL